MIPEAKAILATVGSSLRVYAPSGWAWLLALSTVPVRCVPIAGPLQVLLIRDPVLVSNHTLAVRWERRGRLQRTVTN
jgi:hypothetical protein